jgi:2-polyprenyl-3-methyl-5-hydroxy-6-metoxy-1,4-benzoquinol methylase
MLHEVPDIRSFITELYQLLKPGGRLFITEPKIHVSRRDFENVVELAQMAGFEISERAGVRLGRTVVLVKGAAIDEDNRENI